MGTAPKKENFVGLDHPCNWRIVNSGSAEGVGTLVLDKFKCQPWPSYWLGASLWVIEGGGFKCHLGY